MAEVMAANRKVFLKNPLGDALLRIPIQITDKKSVHNPSQGTEKTYEGELSLGILYLIERYRIHQVQHSYLDHQVREKQGKIVSLAQ